MAHDIQLDLASEEAAAHYFRTRYAEDDRHFCPNCRPEKSGTPLEGTKKLTFKIAMHIVLLKDRGESLASIARIVGSSRHQVADFLGRVSSYDERIETK